MEVNQIEMVRKWPELKSIQNIQVFLGFANFYQRFIQAFSNIIALLTSILKTTGLPDELGPKIGNSNSKIFRFDVSGGGEELAKKLGKLKDQNLAKSQKLSKSGKFKGEKSKKLLKSKNLPNFDATEAGPSFLTPSAREVFNFLWLAFTKALIL